MPATAIAVKAGFARATARAGRTTVALLAVAVLVVLGSWWAAVPASAHAQLIGSEPSDGVTLQAAPSTLRVRLSQSVVPASTKVVLTDGAGHSIPLPALHVESVGRVGSTSGSTGDGLLITKPGDTRVPATIVVGLPSLTPDIYHVAWSTLSADDLHTTSGVIVFGIQRSVAAHSGQVADPAPGALEVALRWTGLAGIAVAAGGICLAALLGAAAPTAARRRLLLLAGVTAAVSAVSDTVLLLEQAGGPSRLGVALAANSYGVRWGVHESAAIAVAGLCLAGSRMRLRGRGFALLGLFGVLVSSTTTALLGHAGADAATHPLRLLLTAAHVTAAMLWVGGVVVLPVALLGRHDAVAWRTALARFSGLATGCVVVLMSSGLALAGSSVASVDAVISSTYGRLLVVKVVLVGLATVVAMVNLRRSRPGLIRRPSRQRWTRTVAVEGIVLCAVLAGSAAIASSRPAVGSEWVPSSAVAPLRSGQVDDLVETLQVSPNRPGRNFVTVDVLDTRRPSPGPVSQVTLAMQQPGGRVVSLPLQRQADGRWLAATDDLSSSGAWALRLTALRPGLPASVAAYGWFVSDPSARLQRPIISSTPLAPVTDRLAIGVLAIALLTLVAAFRVTRRRPKGEVIWRSGAQLRGGGEFADHGDVEAFRLGDEVGEQGLCGDHLSAGDRTGA